MSYWIITHECLPLWCGLLSKFFDHLFSNIILRQLLFCQMQSSCWHLSASVKHSETYSHYLVSLTYDLIIQLYSIQYTVLPCGIFCLCLRRIVVVYYGFVMVQCNMYSAPVWWWCDHIPWHTWSRCILCHEGSWCHGHWHRHSSSGSWWWRYEADSRVYRFCQRCWWWVIVGVSNFHLNLKFIAFSLSRTESLPTGWMCKVHYLHNTANYLHIWLVFHKKIHIASHDVTL